MIDKNGNVMGQYSYMLIQLSSL